MLSSLQFAHVLAHARATNAGMTLGAHVVAKRHHHLLELLKVAVFPVPDCACAITSKPLMQGTMALCWIA